MAAPAFDFFEQQALARRTTRKLIACYVLAVAFVVASYCIIGALLYAAVAMYWGLPLAGHEALEWRGLFATYAAAFVRVPAQLHAGVAATIGGIIVSISACRVWQWREGGEAVADWLGARSVDAGRCTVGEQRCLHVVEEMSIASGIAVPPVYVLEGEQAINALVAGYTPQQAVVIVTQGMLEKLSRDELQGVMGHEFSHLLNGDMALNLYLASVLSGLTWIQTTGEAMVYGAAQEAAQLAREGRGAAILDALFGAMLAFVGFPGTVAAAALKAAISREREFLADAASVQFTRNPEGIAGALDSILALRAGTILRVPGAEEMSHMFFAPAAVRWWNMASHPSIEERIRRSAPRFQRDEYRARRHGVRREVAVLDDLGNVIGNLRG